MKYPPLPPVFDSLYRLRCCAGCGGLFCRAAAYRRGNYIRAGYNLAQIDLGMN